MSLIPEALAISLREGIKVIIITILILSYLKEINQTRLNKAYFSGVIFTLAFSIGVSFFLVSQGIDLRSELAKVIGLTFAFLFIGSIAALYQQYGVNLFGFLKGIIKLKRVQVLIVFLIPVVMFLPGFIGSILHINMVSIIKGMTLATYFSSALGLVLTALIGLVIASVRWKVKVNSFFTPASLLLFFGIILLIGGGIKGFAEMSLMPAVRVSVTKLFHDLIHMFITFLLIPDHPLIAGRMWNTIGLIFTPGVAEAFTIVLLLLPPSIFLYKTMAEPLPAFEAKSKAEARKYLATIKSGRRKKALPSVIAMLAILFSWHTVRSEGFDRWYNPQPIPVVESEGHVLIPLTRPGMDLMDGRLHKFSFVHGDEIIRILVIKRPDGTLSVCLDACEICPPEGYAQRPKEGDLICIYCITPIPLMTVGSPGGCNPIPLKALVGAKEIMIESAEILRKYQDVKTGRTKESIHK